VENQLAAALSRNWWVLLLRGIIAITFGVLAWVAPGASIAALVVFFGAYVLLDGILGVVTAISGRNENESRWALLLWGLVGVGVGVLTFVVPGVTAVVLLFYIAIWAIGTGVLEIVTAVRLRKELTGEWMLVLGGLVSVLFGVILMARPGAGALALMWLLGVYAVVFGILLVVLAFRVRSLGRQLART
jgi:uncharacterized membrane protein HdeD (DUF308 family)